MNNCKRIIYTAVCCLLWNSLVQGQPLRKITAEGYGASEELALDAAKRSAVEISVGTIVSTQTITKNYKLASDNVFSRASGYLKTYQIISCQKTEEGFRVRIEAEVSKIIDDLAQDQFAVDQLLQWLDNPRFMALVEEDNLGEATNYCEIEISRLLAEKHIDLVSSGVNLDSVRGIEADSPQEAASAAAKYGAEMLVLGKAVTEEAKGVKYLKDSSLKSVQAELSAQVIDVSDGSILASFSTHAAAAHISTQSAGAAALKEASRIMTDSLAALLLKYASRAQLSPRRISLTVRGIDFAEYETILKVLNEIGRVSKVHQRSFEQPAAEIGVDYYGRARELAGELNNFILGEKKLKVMGMVGNKITLELQNNQ